MELELKIGSMWKNKAGRTIQVVPHDIFSALVQCKVIPVPERAGQDLVDKPVWVNRRLFGSEYAEVKAPAKPRKKAAK